MKSIEYQIEFHHYWHAGSGLASSTYADLLVNKTRDGLPYLPGRTIKGLLREAAEVIHELDEDLVGSAFIRDVFGQHPGEESAEGPAPAPAVCFFTNATLPERVSNHLRQDDKRHLYQVLAATRIDAKGLAAHGTLRQLEVTVPLTLFATIEYFPEKAGYEQQLQYCFQWIKRIGLNRSRGLGRCKFSLVNSRS